MIPVFEQIIFERGWSDPTNDKGIAQIMGNIEARLSRRLPQGVEFSLTTLQKKSIAHPKFWREWGEYSDVEHLVVQGATSAGKTLLSELNILDTLQHGQKAVVLVPLKAMVHERTEHFRQDMLIGEKYEVYGASSDHMENDERLINGYYDVAVIVYEKFFSMLSQGSAKIMDRCGLLVVDELSMLSKEQRGPKLEMVLEIIREKYPETRIMCLATCDCSTQKICQWLRVPEPIISTARPVPLEEHILQLDGIGVFRLIPADHEIEHEAPERQNEKIEVPGYRSDWRIPQKKKALLQAVIRKIYMRTPNARLLIFVGSQSDAVDIARFLRESTLEWFPQIPNNVANEEYTDFLKKVNACDRDEGQAELIEHLLPHGIAYHHAGISTTLREVIEEEFQKPESPVKAIVATETLTVGVNMPFDAMIMISNEVPRGVGRRVPLTMQEYRNYIGRAGRLGQNNRPGETYLFVENLEDMIRYWNSFYNREEISSALTKATEKELAPYYLSLLTNRVGSTGMTGTNFTARQLQGLFDISLSKVCSIRKNFSPSVLYDNLYDAYLASKSNARPKGQNAVSVTDSYAVSTFGNHIAPYALSIDTCINIYWFFYEGYKHGGFPNGISQQDIESDRYLLDILYHVCRHAEIATSSSLTYPKDDQRPDRSFRAKNLVLQQLRKILSERDKDGKPCYVLWCEGCSESMKEENELWLLTHRINLPDEVDILQAAQRAVLLFYWTQGRTVKEIKENTKFHLFTKVISGDIERTAEVVSFHLDAIYKCLISARTPGGESVCATQEALNAFYALQTRVKYGMPRDLVQLANKHIYGLDRTRLLNLKKNADQRNLSPIQYLYLTSGSQLRSNLTLTQQTQLLQALERRGNVREFDTLMEIVSKDAGTNLTSESDECLRTIAAWDGTNPGELYDGLKALLKNDAFKSTRISTDGDIHCVSWIFGERELCLGLLEKNQTPESERRIKGFFQENGTMPRLIIVPSKDNDAWDTHDTESAVQNYRCTALLDTTFLAMILANTIRIDLGGGFELFEFLTDARGIYTKYEYKYFSLANYIRHNTDDTDRPAFRLVCASSGEVDTSISELKISLSKTKDLQNYEILPWGSQLDSDNYSFVDCPTIILLKREQITRSESLTKFIYLMRQQDFENCLLLLDSESAEQTWNSPECLEGSGCNAWNTQFNKIQKVLVSDTQDAVQIIRDFVSSWSYKGFLIGISYAHFDAQPPECRSDVDKLTNLVKSLAEEYGEHRILFDQLPTASKLFPVNGGERSLAAYETCKLYLILWNYWTKESKNCEKERNVIFRKCKDGAASCMYLQSGQPSDPRVPQPHFSNKLTEDSVSLLQDIREELRKLS